MQALVYRRSIPRYLACQALNRLFRRRFFPSIAPLRLEEREFSPLEGWVSMRVSLCGICGSDISLLRGSESYLMEPYASFPAVLGHEAVGTITEAPSDSGLNKGQRVAVEPMLPCAVRNVAPCRFCAQGLYNLCECFTKGDLEPGMVMGFNASANGGMAEYLAAHPSRIVPIPESMPDETAVLIDSLASALQPALDNLPPNDADVVIYGAGIIGQHLLRCLRALGCSARVAMVARHGFQRDLALAGGADTVLMSPDRAALGKAVGAIPLRTTLGGGNLEGGATHFFDCVGSRRSVQDGLLALRGHGRFIMVATIGTLNGVDFSPLWFRQITMRGTNCYAQGRYGGTTVRTYALAMELLAGGAYPTQGLLTHTYPLSQWREAFTTAFDKRGQHSMKVAVHPDNALQ